MQYTVQAGFVACCRGVYSDAGVPVGLFVFSLLSEAEVAICRAACYGLFIISTQSKFLQ